MIPEIFRGSVEIDGVIADLPLVPLASEEQGREIYKKTWDESTVNRGGDAKHPGRFSSAGGTSTAPGQAEPDSDQESREAQILEDNIGLKRHDMPQITADNIEPFVEQLQAKGIEIKEASVSVQDLKGTQEELNWDKVHGMAQAMRDGKFDPSKSDSRVLASADGHILDGHHRWAAQRLIDPNSKMLLLQVQANIHDLLDAAHDFDEVQYAGVKDKDPVSSPNIQPSKAKVASGGVRYGHRSFGRIPIPVGSRTPGVNSKLFTKATGIPISRMASLVGAPDDAKVWVLLSSDTRTGTWVADVTVQHEKVHANRMFYFQGDGTRTVTNQTLRVKPEYQGQGIGSRMLSKQVQFCREEGIAEIKVSAAGQGPGLGEGGEGLSPVVGYDVWPKMGYGGASVDIFDLLETVDGSEVSPDLLEKLGLSGDCPDAAFRLEDECSVDILELLKHKEGRAWWTKFGRIVHLVFDTSEGSQSSKILDKYIRRKVAARKLPDQYQKDKDTPPQQATALVEEPDLSPEELADLDAMWDEMENDEYTTTDSQDD